VEVISKPEPAASRDPSPQLSRSPDAGYIGAARLGRQRRAGELGGVAGQECGEIAAEPGWASAGRPLRNLGSRFVALCSRRNRNLGSHSGNLLLILR